jgi:Mrp family chromosome partitioning ATPase/capsular polysaccharide biosynthesis protein
MEGRSTPDSAQVADYGMLLRRRWWVIVLGGVVGLLLAIEIMALSAKTYVTSASVLVSATNTGDSTDVEGSRTNGAINLDTEAQLVSSLDVATRARTLLKATEDPRTLAQNVRSIVPPNTSILQISFSAQTPEDAQRGAQAFAQAYLDNRGTSVSSSVKTQIKALQDQIASVSRNLQTATAKKAALPTSSPDYAYAAALENTYTQQISQLTGRLNPLQTTAVTPGRIITTAKLPTTATDPNPRVYLPSGLLLGLLFGLVFAGLLQRVDKRVHSEADVRRAVDLSVITSVAVTKPDGLAAAFLEPAGRTAQSFRRLRNLLVSRVPANGKIVLVAGTSRGLSGSVVAANLAGTLARGGSNTILICADADSRISSLVGLHETTGLSEALAGTVDVSSVRRPMQGLSRLQVIGPGLSRDKVAERVQSEAFIDLLEELRQERSAFIIVEAPPTSSTADAQALAALADVVILAVEGQESLRSHLVDAMAQLNRVQAEVLGVVLVDLSRKVLRWARSRPIESAESTSAAPASPASSTGSASQPAPAFPSSSPLPMAPDAPVDQETMPISTMLTPRRT